MAKREQSPKKTLKEYNDEVVAAAKSHKKRIDKVIKDEGIRKGAHQLVKEGIFRTPVQARLFLRKNRSKAGIKKLRQDQKARRTND